MGLVGRQLAGSAELTDALYRRMRGILFGAGAGELEKEAPGDLDPKLRDQLEALGCLGD